MTREELNTHLLYDINSSLVGLQLMIADYITSDGKANKVFVRQTISDSYDMPEEQLKRMEALDKKCKCPYCRGKK